MGRTPASRLLLSGSGNPSPPPLPLVHDRAAGEQPQAISVDSDTVVILASLLCALICVAGLALVARCTCRRAGGGGGSSTAAAAAAAQAQQPPRGLKKAAIEALPTMSMSLDGRDGERGECAICLALFAEGEELRVLPHCAHSFHAPCIDTWLAAHASCPSCRAAVAVVTCRRCGAACADASPAAAAAAAR